MSNTRTSQRLLASVLPLILLACGSSTPGAAANAAPAAPAPSEATSAAGEASAAPAPASAQATTPASSSAKERLERLRAKALPTGVCTLLSEAALRRHFPRAPAEMETRVRAKPYSSCTYLWVAATRKQVRMAGRVIEGPGEGRVTLTVAPVRAPESDWERVLSSYRSVPPVSVDGIGDKAVWSDQRHQLSVLVPGWVVHVAVEDTDTAGSGREQAVAIGRDILADL